MAGEWQPVSLGELVSIKHGWPFKSEHFSDEMTGRPIVVNIGNFEYTGGFRFNSTTVKEYRAEYPPEYRLRPGDILLVMTCQTPGGEILGIPGRIPDDGRAYLHNQRMGKVVVKDARRVDPGFLYWLFLWNDFNQELVASSSGTKIVHTAPSRIEAFRFDLPPIEEQREIARALGTLDDKIELNRRLSGTLEGLARAVFRSWFVDFDPVVAKAAGRRPVGMTAATAALFPDSFADSPLGPIPKRWRVDTIGDLMQQRREGVSPADSPLEVFEHYSIPAFDNDRQPAREPGSAIRSNKYLVPDGAVLLSKLNPDTPRVWIPTRPAAGRRICSTEFIVAIPRAGFSVEYLYGFFTSQDFTDEFATLVTGTSNSHQRVKPGDLANMAAVLPPAPVCEAYRATVAPLLQRCFQNTHQSATLTSLRDALLPRLLSGELRLKDAERVVGRAV